MPRNDRQDRINELVKWASEQGLEKEIPKRWIEEGDIPSFRPIGAGQGLMDRIASRAKVLYAVSEKTAQDYADVVVRRLIAMRELHERRRIEKAVMQEIDEAARDLDQWEMSK